VLHEKFPQTSPPALPYFYRGSKTGQIFSTSLAFQALWFQNGAIYRNFENCTGCADDWPRYFPYASPNFYKEVKNKFYPILPFKGLWSPNLAKDQISKTVLDNYEV